MALAKELHWVQLRTKERLQEVEAELRSEIAQFSNYGEKANEADHWKKRQEEGFIQTESKSSNAV